MKPLGFFVSNLQAGVSPLREYNQDISKGCSQSFKPASRRFSFKRLYDGLDRYDRNRFKPASRRFSFKSNNGSNTLTCSTIVSNLQAGVSPLRVFSGRGKWGKHFVSNLQAGVSPLRGLTVFDKEPGLKSFKPASRRFSFKSGEADVSKAEKGVFQTCKQAFLL